MDEQSQLVAILLKTGDRALWFSRKCEAKPIFAKSQNHPLQQA
jgi:hypothetical protein